MPAPLAQSVERIHGKDGLRQVDTSNPRRGGDNVKERAGGTGRSACASYAASLRAPDRILVLSALRACSARSTTVKCSTLLYLSGGPVLACPPFTGRRCLSGRPQTTDLAICFVQIVSRNVCVCYSARRWPPVRRCVDKESARRHGRERRSVNVIPTGSGSQVDAESVGGLAPPGQLRRPVGHQFPRRRREHDQVRVDP